MERTIKLERGWTGKWMTLSRFPILIVAVAGFFVTAAVACPILTNAHNDTMPCSQSQGSLAQCPYSFYVAPPQLRADAPILRAIPAAMVPPATLWTSALITEPEPRDDKSPPGHCAPLFIQTHSLLI
jgi:hypothetical protein